MVLSYEKITINNLPKEFKDMALEIKDELKKSAEIMENIYDVDEELKDWINFEENI